MFGVGILFADVQVRVEHAFQVDQSHGFGDAVIETELERLRHDGILRIAACRDQWRVGKELAQVRRGFRAADSSGHGQVQQHGFGRLAQLP